MNALRHAPGQLIYQLVNSMTRMTTRGQVLSSYLLDTTCVYLKTCSTWLTPRVFLLPELREGLCFLQACSIFCMLPFNWAMSVRPEMAWQSWWFLPVKHVFGEIFQEDIIMKTPPTTLLELFCEYSRQFSFIPKSIIEPDEKFKNTAHACMG